MASFAYVAKNSSGEELSGFLLGRSADEVISVLHDQGLVVLRVTERREESGAVVAWRRFAQKPIGRVGTRDLALFTRQLSTVLAAGIPLVRGLHGLGADTTNRMLSRAVEDLATRVEEGASLSEAMAAHPEAFDVMYVSMIRAGEHAGTLDQMLEHVAQYLEKTDAITTKVRSALAYPVFVFLFAVASTLFLLLKIVPTFEGIYRDLGQQLPAMTVAILSVSKAIRSHALLAGAIAGGFVLLLYLIARTRRGRYVIDSILLRLPIFGPILMKSVMSRFARTLGILVSSGLPILEALSLVRDTTGNSVIARAVDQAADRIRAGQGITQAFRSTRKYPEMVLQLMATGEEAGDLEHMLIKTSDFYDRQVEAAVFGLASLLEPLLIVCVGAMIGIIVVAMFLPVFHLGDAIMKGGYNY